MGTRVRALTVGWFVLGVALALAAASAFAHADTPATGQADASATAAAQPAAPAANDCEYLPGDGIFRKDIWSRTKVTEAEAPGCIPQCVARIYCASDHPKAARARVTIGEKYRKGKLISCNANPMVDPTTASCPPPDECNAQAKAQAEKFRIGKDVKPRGGVTKYVIQNGTVFDLKYGLDFNNPNASAQAFTFPSISGEVAKRCHLCISDASVGEGIKRRLICPAKAGPSCDSANDCATAQDAANGALSTMFVDDSHIEHVEPVSLSVPPAGATSGGAEVKEQKK